MSARGNDGDLSAPQPGDHRVLMTPPRQRGLRRRLERLAHTLPTVLVLIALSGIGWWGHKNEWRAPKFASVFGAPPAREPEDWCLEHNVPESRCIKCHPELAGEAAADWCKEHGVPESRCTICHPEILTKGVAGDWCREHGVPESNCTICHPEIAVKGKPPESDGIEVLAPDGMTWQPVRSTASEADACCVKDATRTTKAPTSTTKSAKDPATCQTHALRVQFASAESVKKAGVQLGSVMDRPMEQTIIANAETQYDQTRYAEVAARVPGVVWRVDKQLGQTVKKGDVLALLDAAEVGRVKAELLTASAQRELRNQTVRRISELLPQKISTPAELQEAQAALREAEIRVFNARQALINLGLTVPSDMEATPNERELLLLGLPDHVRSSLDGGVPSANLVPLLSPLEGTLIRRDAVEGKVVQASTPVFAVADTRRIWLIIDVPQSQIGRIEADQAVRFRPERSDRTFQGTITWMSTAVDDQTRTVKVRAELDNEDGNLLASTFGRAQITIRESPNAIAVPNEAIQWEGCCHIVFVRLTDDIFQTRKVQLGARDTHYTEVLAGLLPGEVVATAGSHVLKSEILKSNLGAGCCADE
ncbi:MAG: efflux RND transporter periplasmic adaptor subunit [Phycisphaerae bacterium]|nr:efflux RND transporter periplasmic adaptor subunit [Phycisphaerae bacterium]MCK6497967.1 efflux RND transporter periplasmic adaptor subunit [Nitrospira sp.]